MSTPPWRRSIRLEEVGCELVRVAVPEKTDALALGEIKQRIHIPLIADIHYDPELALIAIEQGMDAVRINPGNLLPDKETTPARLVQAHRRGGQARGHRHAHRRQLRLD